VLGQIDAGRQHEKVIKDLNDQYPQYSDQWQFAPPDYWAAWREECQLADVIIVNSEWSRTAMLAEGVPSEKLIIVPLAYEQPSSSCGYGRTYPKLFSRQRPLRILFLGNGNVCKGILDVIAAAERLSDLPVVFDVVGHHITLPELRMDNVSLHGAVPRSEVSTWYRNADLFVLPTHSDGFALTQLEAMAHGLPVITTRRCGSVVQPGVNGWLIEPGSPQQLAEVIREALSCSAQLAEMSAAALQRAKEFSIETLSNRLCQIDFTPKAARS
jgi:glycosyltransferase involved in cell wall biosynthesis